jgi:hypothetical protein
VFWIFVSVFWFATAAASQEALNKTINISFSHFAPANCADGSVNTLARNVSQQIYISTKGRVFTRTLGRAGSASKERQAAPGETGQFRLSGNKLLGFFPQVSGATRVTITFDPSYQNCTAEVITGLDSGKPFTWINLVGVKCTATAKPVISNISCSVQQGNPFAN